jgi:hypothetical protein
MIDVSVPNRRFDTEPEAPAFGRPQRPRRRSPLRRILWGLRPRTPSGFAGPNIIAEGDGLGRRCLTRSNR